MLAFKSDTLTTRGTRPNTEYQRYRTGYPGRLAAALHKRVKPSTPTTWWAEGNLPYLSAASQDALPQTIAKLIATGSRIAVEALSPSAFDPDYLERGREYVRDAQGDNAPDIHDLLFMEERTDLRRWLTERGWAVTAIETLNLMCCNATTVHRSTP